MSNLVVTTGRRYVDIDGLACVIAYKEIPEITPIAVIKGPLNSSITAKIRTWNLDFQENIPAGDNEFVVVDVSEKDNFPYFVKPEKVIEIYDHHFGFEKLWQEKLGEKAKIEPVGACATLIWEEFKRRKWGWEMRSESRSEDEKCVPVLSLTPPTLDAPLTSQPHPISSLAANLLYTAIVSNTLNFQASVTTERDKKAFEELKAFIDLPNDWILQYYRDQEKDIYGNPGTAVGNDTKIQTIKGQTCAVGEIGLWHSKEFIESHLSQIEATLSGLNASCWFFTSPSISEGKNYIFTKNQSLKDLLSSVIPIEFGSTDIGVTRKLWLRKEILKKIQ